MKCKFIKSLSLLFAIGAIVNMTMIQAFALDMAEYLQEEKNYEVYSKVLNVEKSYDFNVKFSGGIDSTNLGGVQILEKEASLPLEVSLDVVENNILKVSPAVDLEVGKSYYLIVHSPDVASDTVKSSTGLQIERGTVCEFYVQGSYIYNASAIGSNVTSISGNVKEADVVRIEYNGNTLDLEVMQGEFSWNLYPGIKMGTKVNVSAYKADQMLEHIQVVVQ